MKAAETRAFAPLMVSEQSKNLRRVFWLSEMLKGQAPKKFPWRPTRVHVIGAGTMGADIAGWCVASGMQVTLQDVSAEQIEKGIAAQGKLFARKFKAKPQRDAAKARLIADPNGDGLARADVVIEAIVENLEIKQKVLKEVEGKLKDGALLATNTSSLMIEDIAAGLPDPGRLIGLHFFNPVALMPLVEVVRGTSSREDEVKRGAAFVAAIDKFPLITKSVPGFLVNRVLTPYMFGAMQRLENGRGQGAHRRGRAHLRHADGADRARRRRRSRRVRARGEDPEVPLRGLAAQPPRRGRQARQEDGRGLLRLEGRQGREVRARRSTRARWSGSGASSSSR